MVAPVSERFQFVPSEKAKIAAHEAEEKAKLAEEQEAKKEEK